MDTSRGEGEGLKRPAAVVGSMPGLPPLPCCTGVPAGSYRWPAGIVRAERGGRLATFETGLGWHFLCDSPPKPVEWSRLKCRWVSAAVGPARISPRVLAVGAAVRRGDAGASSWLCCGVVVLSVRWSSSVSGPERVLRGHDAASVPTPYKPGHEHY